MTSRIPDNDSSSAPPMPPQVHPKNTPRRALTFVPKSFSNSNLRHSAPSQRPMFGGYYSRSVPDLSQLSNNVYRAPPRVRLPQSPSTPFIKKDTKNSRILKSVTGSIKSMFSRKPQKLVISGPTNLVQQSAQDASSKGASSENVRSSHEEWQNEEDRHTTRKGAEQHRQKPSISWDDELMSSDSSSEATESASTVFEQAASVQLDHHTSEAQTPGPGSHVQPLLDTGELPRSNPVLRAYTAPRSDSSISPTDAPANTHNKNRHKQEPIGQWRCCKCNRGQDLYLHSQGQHIVSTLNCVCPHRSCENCTLTGLIKPYQPVSEPTPVPLSSDKLKQVRFGVFCDNCGLSWRAQIVKGSSMLQQVSGIPKRGTNTLKKIRRAKSMNNLLGTPQPPKAPPETKWILNLRALSNEMEKEHGKQAPIGMVNFSGIQCTCGNLLDDCALCFQVAEASKDVPMSKQAPREVEEVAHTKSFTATPADREKGIGKSMITLNIKGKNFRHLNPLMSNPIDDSVFEMVNDIRSRGGSRGGSRDGDGVSESDGSSRYSGT